MMTAKERATRSRKLKVSAYNSNANAVIAMPAVNIWLTVLKKIKIPSCQLPIMVVALRFQNQS
jgi:hypothetical protein